MALKVVKKGETKPHKPAPAARVKVLQPKPSADLEALRAQVAQVEGQQAKLRTERFAMALEKARIKPEYHGYAMSTLGELDLTQKADLAKIDSFAKTHAAMVESGRAAAQSKNPKTSEWADGYKRNGDGKPRLGDYIPSSAVPDSAGGERS